MLMSQIYVSFVPNVRDQGNWNVLNRLCAFNRKKKTPLTNVLACVIQKDTQLGAVDLIIDS